MNNLSTLSTCIVDDDPIWTNLLTQQLKNAGVQNVTSFNCGEKFLEQKSNAVKLIFLDYQMENINGLQVLKNLKESNPNVEVIFCTGTEDLSVAISALNYGSKDFMLKSNINQNEVTTILNQVFPSFLNKVKAN